MTTKDESAPARVTDAELAEVARLGAIIDSTPMRSDEHREAYAALATMADDVDRFRAHAAELSRWRAPVDVETEVERRTDGIKMLVGVGPPMGVNIPGHIDQLVRPHVEREAALAREVASLRAEIESLVAAHVAQETATLEHADRLHAELDKAQREREEAIQERAQLADELASALENSDKAIDTLRADRDDVSANLEALREKARAVKTLYENGLPRGPAIPEIDGLIAELAKPSGASLVAERDAWKALAKARGALLDAGKPADEDTADAAIEAALSLFRAIDIDPEAP